MIALVEGQEARRRSGKLRGHVDFAIAHRKVDDSAAWEIQQRLGRLSLWAWVAVEAVLVDGVLNALCEVGFQLSGGDWQSH